MGGVGKREERCHRGIVWGGGFGIVQGWGLFRDLEIQPLGFGVALQVSGDYGFRAWGVQGLGLLLAASQLEPGVGRWRSLQKRLLLVQALLLFRLYGFRLLRV